MSPEARQRLATRAGLSPADADLCLRTLRIVQLALACQRFAPEWRVKSGAAQQKGQAAARALLVRRLWVYGLLSAGWGQDVGLSERKLEAVTGMHGRDLRADVAIIDAMTEHSAQFQRLAERVRYLVGEAALVVRARAELYDCAAEAALAERAERRLDRAEARAERLALCAPKSKPEPKPEPERVKTLQKPRARDWLDDVLEASRARTRGQVNARPAGDIERYYDSVKVAP